MSVWTTVKTTLTDPKLHIIIVGIVIAMLLAIVTDWKKNNPYWFYQMITIVVCTGTGIYDTFQTARIRVLATAFGLALGIIASLILPANPYIAILGYILIYYVAEKFGWQSAIRAGGTIFLIANFYHNAMNNENVLVYGAWRLVHTIIGCVIVLVLSYIYLQKDDSGWVNLMERIKKLHLFVNELTGQTVAGDKPLQERDVEYIRQDLFFINQQITRLKAEKKFRYSYNHSFGDLQDIMDTFEDIRVFLYYLRINAYHSCQLDDSTRKLVEEEYEGCRLESSANMIYTNVLAVRKLLAGQRALNKLISDFKIDEVLLERKDA